MTENLNSAQSHRDKKNGKTKVIVLLVTHHQSSPSLVADNLLADARGLHPGLAALVLGDGEVHAHEDDGEGEEEEEGRDEQQRLLHHGQPAKRRAIEVRLAQHWDFNTVPPV